MENNKGSVIITDDVIVKIARIAAGEVEGVASVNSTITGEIMDKINKRSTYYGVSVMRCEDGIIVSLAISIYYEYSAVEVAKNVRSKIFEAVEDMTGEKCAAVNIEVNGVEVKPEVSSVQLGE